MSTDADSAGSERYVEEMVYEMHGILKEVVPNILYDVLHMENLAAGLALLILVPDENIQKRFTGKNAAQAKVILVLLVI